MNMKKNTRSKMQRKIASRRKKWTNAERFDNKVKNLLRLGIKINQSEAIAKRLIAEAEQEITQESEHVHDESCKH